jgi:hypothetical protein
MLPLSHARPQPPQLFGLLWVFTQTAGLPQASVPVGHWQTPAWQERPPVQATPHAPQLA